MHSTHIITINMYLVNYFSRRPVSVARAPYQSQVLPTQPAIKTSTVDNIYQQNPVEEIAKQQPTQHTIPVFRIPIARNKPLTPTEFQNLLQLGGYTATVLPSNPNSSHQEYLLQPR